MNLQPLVRTLDQLDHYPPSFEINPDREQAFLDLGRYLEANIRSGQPFDLTKVLPNPLWQLFEERLHAALGRLKDSRPAPDTLRVHQWYSSGIVLDTGTQVLGFDIVPMRRLYGWEDRFDQTGQLAEYLDALFVTHRHQDHYDIDLVRACLKAGTPVYMPERLARTWNGSPSLRSVVHNQQWEMGDLRVHARTGIHVWRESEDDLPVAVYEVRWPNDTAVVFGGDADYTKKLEKTDAVRVRAYFLPWRAPNALYEEGDARQVAPLHEAVQVALDRLDPAVLFYVHCAELEHVYEGFPASFDMALDLKKRLPVSSELMFWGEWMDLPVSS